MLLQRLVERGRQNETSVPFHRERRFDWLLDLDADGRPTSAELLPLVEQGPNGKPHGVVHLVPAVVRTAGVAPNLTGDDAQYVMGWADADSADRQARRVLDCRAAMVDLHQRWADSDAGRDDPVAQAVAAFFRGDAGALVERPEGCTAKTGILIAVEGVPAYTAESVEEFWSAEVARRKGGRQQPGRCLVCGRVGPLLDTVPAKLPARYAPGASNDVALVSVNERVFGYDLVTGLANTPICMACGDAMSVGLSDVLASDDGISLAGQHSRISWWYNAPVTQDYMALALQPDPVAVHRLLSGALDGVPRELGPDPTRFCSVTVGGNVARLVVRDWVELPLTRLRDDVRAWFEDSAISDAFEPGPRYHRLTTLVRCTGRWDRKRGRYADLGAKGADRPEQVQLDIVQAMMRGRPLPPSLLAHLVRRAQTDARMDSARAALIRVCLRRTFPTLEPVPMPGLDTDNTHPAYVTGRIFAILDDIQRTVAYKTGTTLNATFADRYFAGAVTNPRAALITGRLDAQAWLRKLRRRTDTAGLASHLSDRLAAAFALIEARAGLPGRFTLRDQGLFLIGFHHEQAARPRSKKTDGDPPNGPGASPDPEPASPDREPASPDPDPDAPA